MDLFSSECGLLLQHGRTHHDTELGTDGQLACRQRMGKEACRARLVEAIRRTVETPIKHFEETARLEGDAVLLGEKATDPHMGKALYGALDDQATGVLGEDNVPLHMGLDHTFMASRSVAESSWGLMDGYQWIDG